MRVPKAPMSPPTGNNHRYGVMRPPIMQQAIRRFQCLRGRATLNVAALRRRSRGERGRAKLRPPADAVAGNEEQSPKQIIVHFLDRCKSSATTHYVEKRGQNRVRYATVWRKPMLACA